MITRLLVILSALRTLPTAAAAMLPHLPAAGARACELAGLACAAVFLAEVWPPLVWAAAAAVLLLLGQRR